ncbi:ROK family protein [Thermocrispum agreste]|uniref:ROK family protein n=1 Tax=Thermocrispum agreste TaxID=37925 RepID=UPI0003FEC041|nr:ROK family protein [Thermocrispum agreste]
MSECVIAVDVGGTAIKAGLVDPTGTLHAPRSVPTDRAAGADGVVGQVVACIQELETGARRAGHTPVAVGVAVLGLTDDEAGIAVLSANMGWRDVPFRALLQEKTALPVAFGHDVRAGGLAEAVLGAGRGAGDHLFLAIGTGVAGAIMVGGEPYRGTGFAGEIGHIEVDSPSAGPCGCGGRNCLETVVSARALAQHYAERTGEQVTAAEVAARVDAGDEHARQLWAEMVDALAGALCMYCSLLAPELIVVGGGLAEAGPRLLEPLRARLAERLSFQKRPRLVPAELGERAGCLGAGLFAWQRVGRPVPVRERN